MDAIPVSNIMIRDVKTVNIGSSLSQACRIMNDNKIGSVVVVKNEQKSPAGILTERDVLRHIALDPSKARLKMQELMSTPLITASPETSLREALFIMVSRNIRRLLILQDGKLAGIVTDRDIYRTIAEDELLLVRVINDQRLVKHVKKLQRSWLNILEEILKKHLEKNDKS
ncbi:MAG TPA: CBS domain-containing protein [Nitrososphaera sp.]